MNISLLVFRFKVVARCVAAVVLLAPLAAPAASAGKLQYNRDIKPLLSDNCFACHGPDANTRKAKLRLDTKEGFFGQTKSEGPLLVPGQPEKSALFKRLVTKDQGDLMPPPESHKVLKPEQIARIRQWIAEGAQWQSHWAFLKPERPPLPAVNDKKWGRNPLDAFVLARLEEKGLKPASEADRRTLARRLALDLTGLPPTVEQVEAFVTDSSPRYYERYVQQLLDSPHWGEHRGRAWLDAARYADTHGLHFDNYREMWPYRDWVIKAFNRNLPYDRFITEQLAGDLLAEATDDQRIATGFQRCAMSTNEGGTIDEENVALYASDRVQTIGWVFLGLTANCAGCHDHKFDPVTMKDFYSMAAFFRNTTQPPKDGNVKDTAPSIVVPQTPEDARRWSALPGEITAAKAKVDERKRAAEPLFKTWAAKAQPADLDADLNFPGLLVHVPLNEGQGSLVKGFAGQAADFAASTEKVEWKTGGRFGAAPVLTKQTHFKLGDFGDFERTNRFTAAAWVNAPRVGPTAHASLFGRMDSASNHPGWDLFQSNDEFVLHLVHQWPGNAIRVSTTGKVVKAGKWQHVAATYDGSGKGKGVKLYVDGVEAKLKVDNDTLTQSIHTAQALRIGQRSSGEAFEGGQLQDVRLYGRALSAAEVKTLHAVAPLQTLLALAPEKRTKAQVDSLFEHWLNTRDEPYKQLAATFAALEAERTAIKERNPVTHVQQEKMDSQPMARVLFRGQYDQPLCNRVGLKTILGQPFIDWHLHTQHIHRPLAKAIEIPLLGIGSGRAGIADQRVDGIMAHVDHDIIDLVGIHDIGALLVDHLALVVHHVVVAQQLLTDLEVPGLDLLLRLLERLVDPGVDDRLAFLEAELLQHAVDAVGAEDPHQVVFEREEELGGTGIALAAGAAAELVVDAPALVTFRADHVEAAGLDRDLLQARHLGADRLLLGLALGLVLDALELLANPHIGIAAELDVGASAGHVGGDGDGAGAPRLGDDVGFLLVVAGVQHRMRDLPLLQQLRQRLRLLDRHGADQHRLLALLALLDQGQDGVVLLARRPVDLVVGVLADHRPVGRDLDHLELVDLAELAGLGHRRPGHAREL
ncbi:MAG: DUF1549 domain-containing protein, partial [Verrucomicrobia bacterium]|nr:DUF1549 domain-containing protein [Verrucomicrobiota bacterium]